MSDNSLSSIESEIDQTRARLAATIDQLMYRSSPKTIADARWQGRASSSTPTARRIENIAKVVGGIVGAVALMASSARWCRERRPTAP